MCEYKRKQILMGISKMNNPAIRLHPSAMSLAMCLLVLATLASSCAILYFDPATGTEHLWGIGHMRMKVGEPNEGVRAVVTGTDTLGIAAGSVASERRFTLGWERLSRLRVIDENTTVRFEWPTADLFMLRIGSDLPPNLDRWNNQNYQK
jgi:hypothetical protein